MILLLLLLLFRRQNKKQIEGWNHLSNTLDHSLCCLWDFKNIKQKSKCQSEKIIFTLIFKTFLFRYIPWLLIKSYIYLREVNYLQQHWKSLGCQDYSKARIELEWRTIRFAEVKETCGNINNKERDCDSKAK